MPGEADKAPGVPVCPLGPGIALLAEANHLAATDPQGADRLVHQSLLALCDVEQRQIVQPHYDGLPRLSRRLMAKVFNFRLGYDTAAPVLSFRGTDPGDPEQRCEWMSQVILPAFDQWRTENPEWLRADCDRIRRKAGIKLSELPQRLG